MTTRKNPSRCRGCRGFTLIELMVVVAVVAILAAIALPSYGEAVARSRRTDAKALLTAVQGELERCFTVNATYLHTDSAACPAAKSITGSEARDSEGGFYSISVGGSGGSTLGATAYELVAKRQGAQSTDKCGDFSLSSTDIKAIANQRTGILATDCW